MTNRPHGEVLCAFGLLRCSFTKYSLIKINLVPAYLLKDGLPACSTARQVSQEPWTIWPTAEVTTPQVTTDTPQVTTDTPRPHSHVTVNPGPFVGGANETSSMKCSIIFSCLCVFFNMIRV